MICYNGHKIPTNWTTGNDLTSFPSKVLIRAVSTTVVAFDIARGFPPNTDVAGSSSRFQVCPPSEEEVMCAEADHSTPPRVLF